MVGDTDGGPAEGTMEVQKDAKSRTWYIGRIVDVVNDKSLLIGFDCEGWPNAEYPLSRVRKSPQLSAAALSDFRPKVGEEVEMYSSASEYAPASWTTATIRNIKDSFYFMSGGAGGDSIVEREQLRPPTAKATAAGQTLTQEQFSLPAALVSWAGSSDAAGCFGRIEADTSLFHIGLSGKSLRLLGTKQSIQRARMLLEVHIKHQQQIQSFQVIREKRLQVLEEKRNRIEGHGFKHSCEFKVAASFVPRIIGKAGENITSVQERHGVSIRIIEGKDEEAEKTVRIFGNDQESVDKAREEVEFVEEAMPVETEQKRWVLGTNGKTINLYKELAGLIYARLDRDRRELLLCGSKHSVEDALALYETHMMYHPIVNEMDETMEEILQQLEQYGDRDSRWEWTYWRDEIDKEYDYKLKERERDAYNAEHGGGRRGRKKESTYENSAPAEDGKKGNGKGRKKGKGSDAQKESYNDGYDYDEGWNDYEEEQWAEPEPKERKRPARDAEKASAKASAKASPKATAKASPKASPKASAKSSANDDEKEATKAKSKTAGRQWRAKTEDGADTEGQDSKATAPKGDADSSAPVERPERPAAGTRRMGKNGVRKAGASE
eukprot:TRINITY_DN37627_c0_g1_i1.p1 TRINITY_DN37627_c0_g1~~TRINITY_DN37627_c0_g1_i1.p1  ORF type:complete len:608 (+),score=184.58 TRINITY_DN37627_c0_g1_i1:183-2006(+)